MNLYDDAPAPSPYRLLPVALAIVLLLACGLGGIVWVASQGGPEAGAIRRAQSKAARGEEPSAEDFKQMSREIDRDTYFWTAGYFGFVCVAGIAGVLFSIVATVWTVHDCRHRQGGEVPWGLLVFFAGLPGLIIYLLCRPPVRTAEAD